MPIELGARVKDRITGFSGVAVSVTHWLYGCTRYGVQSETLDKDGKPIEAEWFDEQSLDETSTEVGGPCPGRAETG